MKTDARVPTLLVALLLLPGCLSSVVDDVKEETEAIWEMPGDGEWPRLNLGERTRTSPTLQTYDACDTLLQDLRDALWEQTLVEIDQTHLLSLDLGGVSRFVVLCASRVQT